MTSSQNRISTQGEENIDMESISYKAIVTRIIHEVEIGRSVITIDETGIIINVLGDMKIEEHKICEYECHELRQRRRRTHYRSLEESARESTEPDVSKE